MWFKRPMKFQELIRKVYPGKSINPNLISYFGNRRINTITTLEVETYKMKRLQSVKGSSINREIACLKRCFNQAILWGLLRSKNPCAGIRMLKETPKTRYLTYVEEALIMLHSPQWLKDLISLDLQTGLRLSEILSLTWDAIDLHGKTLTILKSKNGEVRTLPLNSQAYELLNNLKINSMAHRIFNKSKYYVIHVFRKVCNSIDLKDVTFHTLRHTFGSRLSQNNVNVFHIQKLMGHKCLSMTERYSHLSMESLRLPVEQLNNGSHLTLNQ